MSTVIENLVNLKLSRNPKNGTSIEVLENMNKINLICNENISENYATELYLSMCLKSDDDVKKFASAYGVTGDLTLAKFFEEFRKVRMQKDRQVDDYNNFKFDAKYYNLINDILKSKGTIIGSVKQHVQIPTINDYLEIAKKENLEAKEQHIDLDSEINNEDNITGNSLPEYKKFVINNYKEQIVKVSKGFRVKMIMVASSNLSNSQLKMMSKFKNIKTSAMARIVNKRGGYGYLSSPTRERQVKYYPLDKRFFAPIKEENPKKLSYNEMLFYSVYDLNGRALKYKKSHIANAITKSTGEPASSEDIKLVTELTRNLATRYMLFGLNLNNATAFDPNVVFDYRLEALFINKLEKIGDKENNRWILPIVQEMAGNMAIEFFRNASISPNEVRSNLMKAAKYLPEFDRKFDGRSFAGVLFNSEALTYNLGRNANKVKPLKKNSVLVKIKNKFGVIKNKNKENIKVNNAKVENKAENGVEFSKEQTKIKDNRGDNLKAGELEYTLFGKKRVFKAFTFDEYCDHFVKNILEPCASDEKLPKAKEAFDKYNSFEDSALSNKEKLTNVLGEKTLNDFYNNYIDYTMNEAKIRSKNCEAFANVVTNEIIAVVDHQIKVESNIKDENGEIKDKQKIQNLSNLVEAVKNDVSLSSIDDMENLVRIVVDATKAKAESGKVVTEDITFLNNVCREKTDKDLDSYIESLIDDYLVNCNNKKTSNIEIDEFVDKCKNNFSLCSSICIDKLISIERSAKSNAQGEVKQQIQNRIDAYNQIKTQITNSDWLAVPEFSKLNARYESCKERMNGNIQIVGNYIGRYFSDNESEIANEIKEIASNMVKAKTQNIEQEQSNNPSNKSRTSERIKTDFEVKIDEITYNEINKNKERVLSNSLDLSPEVVIRDLNNKLNLSSTKTIEKNEKNIKAFKELNRFYEEMIIVGKDLDALRLKIDNVDEKLSLAENAWLKILDKRDSFVNAYENGKKNYTADEYMKAIEIAYRHDINVILQEVEYKYLTNNLTEIQNELGMSSNFELYSGSDGVSVEAKGSTHLLPEGPKFTKLQQTKFSKMTSIERATKIKEINRELKKEVKIVLDEKIGSIRGDMERMNPKSKAYKFYDLYAKTFASIRRIYDPNSSNIPYKGISQETTVGIKDKIDKYIKKEIVAKITADPKFETLSVEELVKKYTNKDYLKYFVTEVIERSNNALIADNYNLDIFSGTIKMQNDKLISVEEFEKRKEFEVSNSQQEDVENLNGVGEKVEEPEIVEDIQVIKDVSDQVVEEEPEIVEEHKVVEEEPEIVEDIIEEERKKAEEERKAEIAKMKNLSAKGNKIKECKAIIRNDVANILGEKVDSIRDDMTRMNSKNNAYKFYDLYAKAFASVRKLYDSKASNTIYKGISAECVHGVKKNIDAYIEKQIMAKIKNDLELDDLDKVTLVEKYRDMDKLKDFVISYVEENTNTLISSSYFVNLNLPINRRQRNNSQLSPESVKEDIELGKN